MFALMCEPCFLFQGSLVSWLVVADLILPSTYAAFISFKLFELIPVRKKEISFKALVKEVHLLSTSYMPSTGQSRGSSGGATEWAKHPGTSVFMDSDHFLSTGMPHFVVFHTHTHTHTYIYKFFFLNELKVCGNFTLSKNYVLCACLVARLCLTLLWPHGL